MNIAQEQFRSGMAHLKANRVTQALAAFQHAARLAPRAASAHHMAGIALQRLGRLDEADKAIGQAIAVSPRDPDFFANRSLVRCGLKAFDLAIADARTALHLSPEHIPAQCNLGLAQIGKQHYFDAAATFSALLVGAPSFAAARENLLLALRNIQDLDRANEAVERFVAIAPKDSVAWYELGMARYKLGRQMDAVDAFRRAVELAPDDLQAHSLLLFTLNFLDDQTTKSAAIDAFGKALARSAAPRTHLPIPGEAEKTLRLGFVSGDLREHSVSSFLLTAMPALRARGLQLLAYQTKDKTDAVTERLRPMFDAWRDITSLSDEAAADLIAADGIDILFDLAGHTSGRRQRLFSIRPAPLAISWLGYSATTGNPGIDFVLCNRLVLPVSEEPAFTEHPLHMAGSYLCFSPTQVEPPEPQTSGMVFGSFNTLNKLGDRTVAMWSRILLAVPDSKLLLKARAFRSDDAKAETADRFARYGISPERLILLERSPDRASHLALYGQMSMALDPWPYSGTTTTMEALSMGVPVLTMNAGPFISRVSASLLAEAGLADWIASDEDDYVAKAVAAADPQKLAAERVNIKRIVAQSRLYDAAAFSADFDSTLRRAWREWCAGVGKRNT